MKMLLVLLMFFSVAHGAQRGEVGLRKPVGTPAVLDTSGTNVTSSAYVTLQASTSIACSAALVQNSGSQPIKLAIGGAGSEVDTGFVIPVAQLWLIPIEIAKSVRLSVKSLGGTQSAGFITLSCFQ